MAEWLDLCDAITRAGGRILVMPPAESKPPATGMIYTANCGALFRRQESFSFMVSKMAVAHRQGEHDHIASFFKQAGVPTNDAPHCWEGQADVTPGHSAVGGGSFPAAVLPTTLVSLDPGARGAASLALRLRLGTPPVICRIEGGKVLLDPRTLPEAAIPIVAEAVRAALAVEP